MCHNVERALPQPEAAAGRNVRRRKRGQERRGRLCIMHGRVCRDVRPDKRARIGERRKLRGRNDLDQDATQRSEEKLCQHPKKLKSKSNDLATLDVSRVLGILANGRNGVWMLDMTTNRIVLAGIEPDADTVSTTVNLNTLNPFRGKRAFTFGARHSVLALPHRGSRHTGCWRQSRGVHRRRQQSLAREPDSCAVYAMRERGPANCLQPESATISRKAKHIVI